MASEREIGAEVFTSVGPVVYGPGGFKATCDTQHEARWLKRILHDALEAAERTRGEVRVVYTNTSNLQKGVSLGKDCVYLMSVLPGESLAIIAKPKEEA